MYIHVYTFQDMSVPCMYMFVFFNNCLYYVCQLTYDSIVHSLYVHGTDMYVHIYARWSEFQMNPIHLDRIRQNCTYWYVPVRTSTYQYMPVQKLYNGTYQYVPVRTRNRTLGYLIHAGRAQKVNCNSVQLPCKSYDGMMSKLKKNARFRQCKYILVRTGTYWYVPVFNEKI